MRDWEWRDVSHKIKNIKMADVPEWPQLFRLFSFTDKIVFTKQKAAQPKMIFNIF